MERQSEHKELSEAPMIHLGTSVLALKMLLRFSALLLCCILLVFFFFFFLVFWPCFVWLVWVFVCVCAFEGSCVCVGVWVWLIFLLLFCDFASLASPILAFVSFYFPLP